MNWKVSRNTQRLRMWPFMILITGRKVQILENNVAVKTKHFDIDHRKEGVKMLKSLIKHRIDQNEKEYNKLCDIEDQLL